MRQPRRRVFSGAPWEQIVGYCRAIRVGDVIAVTGTVSIGDDGSVFAAKDPFGQAKRCFEIIESSLAELDAKLSDVIRTRLLVTDIDQWEAFGRAHGEVFGAHPPATTMVEVSRLIRPEFLIEVEADAIAR